MKGFFNYISQKLAELRNTGVGQFIHNLSQGVQNGFSSLYNKYTGAGLTGAEQAFMQYQTSERMEAQQFEKEMSSSAFQRQVADMQAAGLNPALMYGSGSNGASTPSSSGQTAPGYSPASMSDLFQLLTLKKQMKILDAQAENIEATTDKTKQDTKLSSVETDFKQLVMDMYPDITNAQINDLLSHSDKNIFEGGLAQASEALTWAKKEFQDKENDSYKELLELRKAIMKADEGVKLSEKEKNEAIAWLNNVEAKYEHDTGMKMSSNQYLCLALAIGQIFGVSPEKITGFLKGLR